MRDTIVFKQAYAGVGPAHSLVNEYADVTWVEDTFNASRLGTMTIADAKAGGRIITGEPMPPRTPSGQDRLLTACWCERFNALLSADDVLNGRTWSCGSPGCEPPEGSSNAVQTLDGPRGLGSNGKDKRGRKPMPKPVKAPHSEEREAFPVAVWPGDNAWIFDLAQAFS